jgi:hypothetical protein
MNVTTGVIHDPANQILDDDSVLYATLGHDDVNRKSRLGSLFRHRWGLGKGLFNLFCQVVVRVIRLVLLVPAVTLPPVEFSTADRTTRLLASLLSDIRQEPLSANTTRAFSISHYIFSEVKVRKNIKADRSSVVNRRRGSGGLSGV